MPKPSSGLAGKAAALAIVLLAVALVAVAIYAAMGSPQRNIDDALSRITDEASDAKTRFDAAEAVYKNARLKEEEAKQNFDDSLILLNEAQKYFDEAKSALTSASADLEEANANYAEASEMLRQARENYAAAQAELSAARAGLAAAQTAFEDARQAYQSATAVLEQAITKLNQSEAGYQAAAELINDFFESQGSIIPSAREIYNRTIDAIVEIRAYDIADNYFKLGSGFFIGENGVIVTNYHVIQNAFRLEVFHNDGNFYEAEAVLGYDAGIDLAIIKIDKADCVYLEISDKKPEVGDTVYAAGSNMGLTRTFTKGIVSYVDREIEGFEANSYIHYVGITHSGNSGGAILNSEGEVIGVHQLGDAETGDNGLAIPISQLDKIARDKNETPVETTFNNARDISDDVYYTVGLDNKVTITGVKNLIQDAVIRVPSQIDGKQVAYLNWGGNSAFLYYVEHIVISEGIKRIGADAFSSAVYLLSVSLPSTLEDLSDTAFAQATELYRIFLSNNPNFTLADEVLFDSGIATLYKYPLCKSYEGSPFYTESYEVPDGVQKICEQGIFYALGLRSLKLPATLERIETMGIAYCLNLQTLTLPEGLEYIGVAAFAANINLKSITVPASVTRLGERLDDGSGYIYKGVFFDCLALETVAFAEGSSLGYIGDSLFGYCQSLKTVTGLTGATEIGNATFLACYSLKNIDLSGLEVENMGVSAFRNCSALESVILPDTLTAISDNTFMNSLKLQQITLPAGVKSIGTDAFYGASSLTQAVLPAGLESIGDGAFYGCESLSAINLTDTQIKHLGAYSFCLSGLTSVTLPDTLGIVGEYAFAECAGLVALTLSANTLWLKGYAFYGCSELKIINAAACLYPPHLSDAGVFEGASKLLVIDVSEARRLYFEYDSAWMVYRDCINYI